MSGNRPIFLSSCFEDPKGTSLTIRDRVRKMTGGDAANASFDRPIWMAEDFRELDRSSPWGEFEKCEFCLEGVRRAECFIAIITNRYGSTVTIDGIGMVATSFFEAELFEAALLGKPSFIFFLKGCEPEGKLANLIKLLAPSFPHMEHDALSEDQILRKIDRLVTHYQRPRWLRRILAAPKLKQTVDALITQRHRPYDPRSSPPPYRFLEGSRFDPHIERLDPRMVESVLERAASAESHQVRLTLTWFAIRALMAAPFDDPAQREFVPLWLRAFGTWTRSAAWYGLHGYCVMSRLAALGTLAEIGMHSASKDDPSPGLPHGPLASEYYSVAKLTSRPDPFLDLALTHIQLGIDSNQGDTTNQLAIKASILLRMKRSDEGLKDYERVAENRKERGGQPYGEALNEWGYALLKTGKKSQGVARMEAGVELLKAGPPSGFQVRAMRKLAEGYTRCLKFRAALDVAAKAHDLAVKIGTHDQIDFLDRFAKRLGR